MENFTSPKQPRRWQLLFRSWIWALVPFKLIACFENVLRTARKREKMKFGMQVLLWAENQALIWRATPWKVLETWSDTWLCAASYGSLWGSREYPLPWCTGNVNDRSEPKVNQNESTVFPPKNSYYHNFLHSSKRPKTRGWKTFWWEMKRPARIQVTKLSSAGLRIGPTYIKEAHVLLHLWNNRKPYSDSKYSPLQVIFHPGAF